MNNENKIVKGHLVSFSSGEHDSYQIDANCMALIDFDVSDEVKKWKEEGSKTWFYLWLEKKGCIKILPYKEISLPDDDEAFWEFSVSIIGE